MMAPQPLAVDRGPIAPPPPAGLVDPADGNRPANKAGQKPKAKDSARAGQLVLMGDRLFRGNNIKKAEERYVQATRLDPSAAAPLVGLAQVALVRVQYAEAARRMREAETAQPGWIVTAPDIQSIYGEPGDFARHLARLESHLQVHPDDRDAWLVLGAEWYLSGRTARAADVFLRLNDPKRKPDIALSAFLHATNQE
jgi:tetratricopeptide (TPR) repeat protein